MIKWALRRAIDKFERDWNYDASYMRDMIDASPRAAWLFARVAALGQFRRDLQIEAWCAAGITANPLYVSPNTTSPSGRCFVISSSAFEITSATSRP